MVAGIMSVIDDGGTESVGSDPSSSTHQDRIIIVANQLPIKVHQRTGNSKEWTFTWDEHSLLLQLKDG